MNLSKNRQMTTMTTADQIRILIISFVLIFFMPFSAWSQGPANDDFADALVLTEAAGQTSGSNVNATKEAGEPSHDGKSVWWTWTAPQTDVFHFDTAGTSFDAVLKIYTGSDIASLTEVPSNADSLHVHSSNIFHDETDRDYEANYYMHRDGSSDIAEFLGTWINNNSETRGMTRLIIGQDGSNATVHVYGSCSPTDCDWGEITVPFTGNPLTAVYEHGFVTNTLTIERVSAEASKDSGLTFQAQAGVQYHISVDGLYEGDISLNWQRELLHPGNDDLANATLLNRASGLAGRLKGSNADASHENDEPDHAGERGGVSVWWTWEAPQTGLFSFDTHGSSFDTLLAVYKKNGDRYIDLTEIASNDDDGSSNNNSGLTFQTQEDIRYYIAVDGYYGDFGNIVLNWTLVTPKPSDDFNNAPALSGLSGQASGSNTDATKQEGEPLLHAGDIGGKSVWWTWTPSQSGYYSFDTHGSSFDTLLSVYTGSGFDNLAEVASNDNDGSEHGKSGLTFLAQSDVQYHIAIDGARRSFGDIILNWRTANRPVNDDFDDALMLSGEKGEATGSNKEATKEPNESTAHGGHVEGGKSVWWVWTAPKTDYFFFEAMGSSSHTTLVEIYTGSNIESLTGVTGTFYAYYYESHLIFRAQSGVQYHIAVDGYEGSCGDIALKWGIEPPPENNDFVNAYDLNGFSGRVTASNMSATKEIGEPAHAGDEGGRSVWWTWTAPESGELLVNTTGSDFNTLLAVYTASDDINNLTEVAINDHRDSDDETSSLTFQAEANVQYYVAVDGYENDGGEIVLNWTFLLGGGKYYEFERMWPTLRQPWYFRAYNLAIDTNDFVYIPGLQNNVVTKFTADGQLVSKWEIEADEYSLIASDSNGFVYVIDSERYVEKFAANGQLENKWKIAGDYYAEFGDMVIDSNGFFYITDVSHNLIRKFTPDGQLLTEWGSNRRGDGDGEFYQPDGIAIDNQGFVYIADTQNHRIQKFTEDGQFVMKWGTEGEGEGDFERPRGIKIKDGFLYVADTGNNRVQKFTLDGQFLEKWEYGMWHIAFDSNGFVYGVMGNELQKFSPDGQLVDRWSSKVIEEDVLDSVSAVDSQGYIYSIYENSIRKFTPDGELVTKWGGRGWRDGEFESLIDIAVDSNDVIYSIDVYKHTIQKFTSDGEFISRWEFEEYESSYNWPADIAVDAEGYIYVVDTLCPCVRKFNSEGQYLTLLGDYESEEGEFVSPSDVVIDKNGFVYVADNNKIHKLSLNGEYLTQWGSEGRGNGEFGGPVSITIDSKDFLYVADSYNDRIQKFTLDGQFITAFGEFGSNPGQLNFPRNLVVIEDGKIYVSDSANNRVQIFKPTLTKGKMKAIIVAGGGPYNRNTLWDATQMSANFAYRTLTFQGFTKETIFYLSSDLDLDLDSNGEPDDVDADVTNENLQHAITEWAADADSLVMYLTDHGGTNVFRMNGSELLLAADLDSWTDTFQTNVPETGDSEKKVIFIYDACYSGSFLNLLTPVPDRERISISSASPDEAALFISQGTISFSNYFWTHIFNGYDLSDAFTLARDSLESPIAFQHPLLDGDGNGIGNEPHDLISAQGIYIGNGTEVYGEIPRIGNVSWEAGEEPGSARLIASDVTDNDGIASVRAVIWPPGYDPDLSGSAIQNLPGIDLMPVEHEPGRYENLYDSFHTEETYRITVYARDRAGNTSAPKLLSVRIANPLRHRAIILAGEPSSEDAKDALWPAIQKNSGLAYDTLTFQGYADEDIFFISPVPFSSGWDSTPTRTYLKSTIETWAGQNTEDVVIFMTGNEQDGMLELNDTETLSPQDLDAWLDKLQETLPGKVIVIYDASCSGEFLSALTTPEGKERILISSATGDQPASFIGVDDDTISFSQFFWRNIAEGATISDAFVEAKRAVRYLGRRSGTGQVPDLYDNGGLAQDYVIGNGIMTASDAPLIGSVSEPQILSGETSADIRVSKVIATAPIKRVLAVVMPPVAGTEPSGAVSDLPVLELDPVGAGQYKGTYSGFYDVGVYQIVVYAVDERGSISLPGETQIEQTVAAEPSEILWLSVTIEGPVSLTVYAPDGTTCDKEACDIPEANIDLSDGGEQTISLAQLGAGDYRFVLHGAEAGSCLMTVSTYHGAETASEETNTVGIEAHQVLRADVSVSSDLNVTVGDMNIPVSTDGTPLVYDFDGSGGIDETDIEMIASKWNTASGDPEYDPFYDLDDDGHITVLDIMQVVSNKFVP